MIQPVVDTSELLKTILYPLINSLSYLYSTTMTYGNRQTTSIAQKLDSSSPNIDLEVETNRLPDRKTPNDDRTL